MLLNKRIELLTLEGSHKVQKRRIYDITNILEGIGFIEEYFKKLYTLEGYDDFEQKIMDDHAGIKLYLQLENTTADIDDFASWMASSSLLQRTSRDVHNENENQAADVLDDCKAVGATQQNLSIRRRHVKDRISALGVWRFKSQRAYNHLAAR
ncbi:hypothetical protein OIU76_001347 [Salix suchowensis]|nr:hypothetical protein OIU76_001347 [Salix suchowensis]